MDVVRLSNLWSAAWVDPAQVPAVSSIFFESRAGLVLEFPALEIGFGAPEQIMNEQCSSADKRND